MIYFHRWSGVILNTTPGLLQAGQPVLDNLSTDDFLMVLGHRVRRRRAEKSMSRKRLAEVSGVSERYLAQLESGQGNMSIALLRKVTTAIGMSLGSLLSEEVTESFVESRQSVSDHTMLSPSSQAAERKLHSDRVAETSAS